jgi:cysteine desulfurase / selenocysteine lyase
VARGWEHRLRPGDEILVTEMEHHANLVPWMMLAKRRKLNLRYIPCDSSGRLELSRLPTLLNSRTRVVALAHVSNVLGTINPVADVAERARRIGALVVLDAAQAVGHMPVDFAATGADLMAFSAHKVYGPTGLGALIGRPAILDRLEPMEGGGEMIASVDFDEVTWAPVPHRFEAGTANVAAAAAFPAAIELLEAMGAESVRQHEVDLVGHAWEQLSTFDGMQLLGPSEADDRGGLISFHDPRVHPHDLATSLDQQGIAVRAGHHCAQPLHRKLGLAATCRASFGVYSRIDDIDALVEGIRFARSYFS